MTVDKRKIDWAASNVSRNLSECGLLDSNGNFLTGSPFHDLVKFIVFNHSIVSYLENNQITIYESSEKFVEFGGDRIYTPAFLNEIEGLIGFYNKEDNDSIVQANEGCFPLSESIISGSVDAGLFNEKVNEISKKLSSSFSAIVKTVHNQNTKGIMNECGYILTRMCMEDSPEKYTKLTAIQCGMVINGSYNLNRAMAGSCDWEEFFRMKFWSGCLDPEIHIQELVKGAEDSGKLLLVSSVDMLRFASAAHTSDGQDILMGIAKRINGAIGLVLEELRQQDETPA